MCDQCLELDEAIEWYRLVIALFIDPEKVSEATRLLAETVAQKAALHTE
jgi:RNA polymerase subunit RPABC4/transcription elongation factor Spt4